MARMVAARRAAKLRCTERRAAKREIAKAERAADRDRAKAEEKARKAAIKAAQTAELAAAKQRAAEAGRAEREAQKAARSAVPTRRPRGRPPKPRPRAARWTDWQPSHALSVYHAIKRGDVNTGTRSIAAFLGQHWNTVNNWRHRHVGFERAIERGIEDRGRVRGAILSCRRVEADPTTFNREAKTVRGLLAKAKVQVWFDAEHHAELLRGGHLKAHMRRRWHERPPGPAHWPEHVRRRHAALPPPMLSAALGAIEAGAVSNHAIAAAIFVAESTLRNWRNARPDFDRAILDAARAQRECQADQEHHRAWRRVAWQVARGLETMADADAYQQGLIQGEESGNARWQPAGLKVGFCQRSV